MMKHLVFTAMVIATTACGQQEFNGSSVYDDHTPLLQGVGAGLTVEKIRYGISLRDSALASLDSIEDCRQRIAKIPYATVVPFDASIVMITGYIEADVVLGAEAQFKQALDQMTETCVLAYGEEPEPAYPSPSTRVGN